MPPTILFAGGGTGGHIGPNLAVIERLREHSVAFSPRLLVSARPVDAEMLAHEGVPFTALPARPLVMRPAGFVKAALAFRQSVKLVRRLIADQHVAAVLATGGFVSGPAIAAARSAGVPAAVITLDAVAGKANRLMSRRATAVFSAYPAPVGLPGAVHVGYPLRRAAVPNIAPAKARQQLGLDPTLNTLLVFGGSQAAETINRAVEALLADASVRAALRGWQVLHIAGPRDVPRVTAAMTRARVPGVAEAFCHRMGLAWASADVVIARAGAGTVAEAWANAVPTVFLPYPHHRDEHQRHNAQPLVGLGGAAMLRDRVDAPANAASLAPVLLDLLGDAARREGLRAALRASPPADGAAALAEWLAARLPGPG